jgi:hypothetical protein
MSGVQAGGRTLGGFHRQTLVGSPSGVQTYYSPILDTSEFRSLTWWLELYGSLPGTSGPPVTAFIESGFFVSGPWRQLIPGGQSASAGAALAGSVSGPSAICRLRIDLQALEITTLQFLLIGRRA